MREILYRGKRLDNGEWMTGVAFPHDDNGCTMFYQCPSDGSLEGREVDPDTVSQYIGLTDKDGKKIFEGDILEFVNDYNSPPNKWKCKVEFFNASFICRFLKPDAYGEYFYSDFLSWNAPFVKWWVIGNIYDNPELMEEGEQ